LAHIAAHGVKEIILLAGHLGALIHQRYHGRDIEGGSRIEVVIEPEAAGTGGALRYAADSLQRAFFMFNGDSFFDCDFRQLEQVLAGQDLAAIALRPVEDTARYGSVDASGGRVVQFIEKAASRTGSGTISAGNYLLRRNILDRIGKLPCSIEQDVFPTLAAEGKLACRCFDGYFIDIGLPSSLAQGRKELPSLLGS
jgi:D-glycero-D-manno-heptose 1,7-bisphosphate phosphatase